MVVISAKIEPVKIFWLSFCHQCYILGEVLLSRIARKGNRRKAALVLDNDKHEPSYNLKAKGEEPKSE